jgi:ammonia channel protein AmtB
LSEVYGAVIGGLVAAVLAAIAWLMRDWRVVVVVYAFLGIIAGLVLLAAADAWP